jgi:hypothetical protein
MHIYTLSQSDRFCSQTERSSSSFTGLTHTSYKRHSPSPTQMGMEVGVFKRSVSLFSLCWVFRTRFFIVRCLLLAHLDVCALDQNRSRPLPNAIFRCVCVSLSQPLTLWLIHASAPAQHLSPSVLKSFNFLPWFACAKAGNTSAVEWIWINFYKLLLVFWCIRADVCSAHLFRYNTYIMLRVDWRKLRLIYMILKISCYVYVWILRDGVRKRENWCSAAFFWKYRCLYCCSLHILYDNVQ